MIITINHDNITLYLDDSKLQDIYHQTLLNNPKHLSYPYSLHWHNTQGPAIVYDTGEAFFYLYDEPYELDQFIQATNLTDNQLTILKLKYPNL